MRDLSTTTRRQNHVPPTLAAPAGQWLCRRRSTNYVPCIYYYIQEIISWITMIPCSPLVAENIKYRCLVEAAKSPPVQYDPCQCYKTIKNIQCRYRTQQKQPNTMHKSCSKPQNSVSVLDAARSGRDQFPLVMSGEVAARARDENMHYWRGGHVPCQPYCALPPGAPSRRSLQAAVSGGTVGKHRAALPAPATSPAAPLAVGQRNSTGDRWVGARRRARHY